MQRSSMFLLVGVRKGIRPVKCSTKTPYFRGGGQSAKPSLLGKWPLKQSVFVYQYSVYVLVILDGLPRVFFFVGSN